MLENPGWGRWRNRGGGRQGLGWIRELSRAFAIESWQINAKGSSVSTRRFPLAEVLRVAEFLEATLLNDFHRNVIDDSISIHCKRCRCNFRDRARRVQSGYSRQCPSCEVVIFFEEHVSDENVKSALLAARNLRRALKESEGVKVAARSARIYDRSST